MALIETGLPLGSHRPRGAYEARYLSKRELELRAPPTLDRWTGCEKHSLHHAAGYTCPGCERERDEQGPPQTQSVNTQPTKEVRKRHEPPAPSLAPEKKKQLRDAFRELRLRYGDG